MALTKFRKVIMALFTVRVELREAEREDYAVLHEEMALRGFGDTITGSSGSTYQLPDAEYNYEGKATRAEVLAMAKAAAEETGVEYAVFVTEAAGRTWFNLRPA